MNADRFISWSAFLLALAAMFFLCIGAIYYQGQLGYYRRTTEEVTEQKEEIRMWQAYISVLQKKMIEAGIKDVPPLPTITISSPAGRKER